MSPNRQPNILSIMADQLAAPFLPCYGHSVVQAPEHRWAQRTRHDYQPTSDASRRFMRNHLDLNMV